MSNRNARKEARLTAAERGNKSTRQRSKSDRDLPRVERSRSSALSETPKRDRQRTEEKLFQAGVQVMSELGYDAATTKVIAAAAGVNEQLIARYFGGKAGLLVAILRSYIKSERAEVQSAQPTVAATLESEIIGFLRGADFPDATEPFARLALGRAAVDSGVAEAINDLRKESYTPFIVERLREHQARGIIAPGTNLQAIADSLVHLRFGLAAYGRLLFGVGSDHLRTMIEQTAAALARGLSPPFLSLTVSRGSSND